MFRSTKTWSKCFLESGSFFVWGFGQHGALSFQSFFKNCKTPMEISLPCFDPKKREAQIKAQQEEAQKPSPEEVAEKVKSGDLRKVKVEIIPDEKAQEQSSQKLEERELVVTAEQEEMFARMQQLPRPRVPKPDPRGFPMDHEDYPFIIEGQKVRK